MGRGRGKGKKLTVTNHEDPLSGEEENIPIQKRRGRPQKLMKDDMDEEDGEKIDEEEDTETRSTVVTENLSSGNAKKRKKYSNVKEKQDSLVKEDETSIVTATSTDSNNNSTKSNGFRHIGSRRKSTPRRAAEAGVECN